MKKEIILGFILGMLFTSVFLFMFSCGPSKAEIEERQRIHNSGTKNNIPSGVSTLDESDVTIYIYRDCYYLVSHDGWNSSWGSHMGNYPNPIHKENKNVE
jgi:hypothetical protein